MSLQKKARWFLRRHGLGANKSNVQQLEDLLNSAGGGNGFGVSLLTTQATAVADSSGFRGTVSNGFTGIAGDEGVIVPTRVPSQLFENAAKEYFLNVGFTVDRYSCSEDIVLTLLDAPAGITYAENCPREFTLPAAGTAEDSMGPGPSVGFNVIFDSIDDESEVYTLSFKVDGCGLSYYIQIDVVISYTGFECPDDLLSYVSIQNTNELWLSLYDNDGREGEMNFTYIMWPEERQSDIEAAYAGGANILYLPYVTYAEDSSEIDNTDEDFVTTISEMSASDSYHIMILAQATDADDCRLCFSSQGSEYQEAGFINVPSDGTSVGYLRLGDPKVCVLEPTGSGYYGEGGEPIGGEKL